MRDLGVPRAREMEPRSVERSRAFWVGVRRVEAAGGRSGAQAAGSEQPHTQQRNDE